MNSSDGILPSKETDFISFLSFSAGMYSDTGLAPCAPCPRNFFQPLSGQRQCFECHSTEETEGVATASKDECRDVDCPQGELFD